jgi:hypothetical protein
MMVDFKDRVTFAVGTGRCGTQFLQRVLATEPEVAASHERNSFNESFHRYCKWYRLPVDDEGFLHEKEKEIRRDLAQRRFSFEASAYLSLSIKELYERFGAKFILLVRRPDRVVNSTWVKGFYAEPYVQADPQKALGYQPQEHIRHFFSRIAPMGAEFVTWNKMTRIGKIAWFWNAINLAVVEQFAALPSTQWRVVKLEELSYAAYLELAKFMGFESRIAKEDYQRIADDRPNTLPQSYRTTDWSNAEISEFEAQVRPAAERLGYPYQVRHFVSESGPERRGRRFNPGRFLREGLQRIYQKPKQILQRGKVKSDESEDDPDDEA